MYRLRQVHMLSKELDNGKELHIHFTSDEEIKEGDWYLFNDEVHKADKVIHANLTYYLQGGKHSLSSCRKIIATTDKKLTIEKSCIKVKCECVSECKLTQSLPQIQQSFVKEYVKQGGIDEVELEYELMYTTSKGIDKIFPTDNRTPIYDNRIRWETLKLTPNNGVIVHLIEEKIYSLKELKNLFKGFEYVERTNSTVNIEFTSNIEAETFSLIVEEWTKEKL